MNLSKHHVSSNMNFSQLPGVRLACGFSMTASLALILVEALPGARVAIFHAFNNLGPLAPGFWSGMTAMADTYLALGLLLPFMLWRPRLGALLLLSALIATAITHSIKPILDVPRPPAVLAADAMHLIGHRLDHGSFPSGHAVTAFTLAGLLIVGLRLSVGWSVLVLLAAALLGVSRMAVGVHWPTDVLAGAVIGLISVMLAQLWLNRWSSLNHARWPLPAGVVVTAICALSSPWFNAGYPLGEWANWSVAGLGLVALFWASLRYWPQYRNRQRLPLKDLGRK